VSLTAPPMPQGNINFNPCHHHLFCDLFVCSFHSWFVGSESGCHGSLALAVVEIWIAGTTLSISSTVLSSIWREESGRCLIEIVDSSQNPDVVFDQSTSYGQEPGGCQSIRCIGCRQELIHDGQGRPVALINGAQFGSIPGNPGE
jgi:hypothetical protein